MHPEFGLICSDTNHADPVASAGGMIDRSVMQNADRDGNSLKKLGFDKVFDTCFGADLTIIEEGTELIERIKNKGPLPLITSCSPGWVIFFERFYPEMLPLLSSCKSPMQMTSPLIKTYYAEKNGIDPKDIVSVALMPCVAKKFEARRPEMKASSYQDTDYVLTTREIGKILI